MMYIKDEQKTHIWHVGDPLPKLSGKVITFQADGEELEKIIEAINEKTPAATKLAYVVTLTEYQRWWGSKPIAEKYFTTRHDAEKYAKDYNKKYNSANVVPDYYIIASVRRDPKEVPSSVSRKDLQNGNYY